MTAVQTRRSSGARQSRRLRPYLAALVALAMIAVACGGQEGPSDPEESSAEAPEVDTGAESDTSTDELVIAIIGDPQGMRGELTFKEPNSIGLRNVYEQLTTIDPNTNEVAPLLATDWEQIEPTRWRFNLREGVTFHDGTPFNAESAAFNVNWVWGADQAFVIRSAMGPQITAEVVDEYTIDVLTETPDPLIPGRMTLPGIQSMEQIQADPDEANAVAIGTGPYQFVEWNQGQNWIAEANPDWWGHDAADAPGQVTFERLRFEVREEDSVRAAMAETGEADISMYITPEQCADADADSNRRCIVETSDFFYFGRIDFQGAHPALSDMRVREAINLAIDADAIREQIMGLGAQPQGQLLPEGVMGYNADLAPYPYDPEMATELLDEARADGVDVDGLELHVAARQGTFPRSQEIVEAVGGMLSSVGISNTVAFEEPGVINPRIAERASDGQRGFVLFHPDSNPLLDFAFTLNVWASCESVVSAYCDDEFNAALREAETASGADRESQLNALVQQAHDEHLFIPIALVERAYSVPVDLEWNFAIDHRVQAVQMTVGR